MKFIKKTANKLGVFKEVLAFFWANKLWWLLPFILVLLLFGLLMIFAQGTAVAPFIYTLF